MAAVSLPPSSGPIPLRDQLSSYVPIAAFGLLSLLALARAYVHWPRPLTLLCCSPCARTRTLRGAQPLDSGSSSEEEDTPSSRRATKRLTVATSCAGVSSQLTSKFYFHIFLLIFALGRLTVSLLLSPDMEGRSSPLAVTVTSAVSGCTYLTLLLFLEMHWRDILDPIGSIRGRRAVYGWGLFVAFNALLYGAVGVTVWRQYTTTDGGRDSTSPSPLGGQMWWSIAVVDAASVVIAVSYTVSALALYVRVSGALSPAATDGGGAVTKVKSSGAARVCGALARLFLCCCERSGMRSIADARSSGRELSSRLYTEDEEAALLEGAAWPNAAPQPPLSPRSQPIAIDPSSKRGEVPAHAALRRAPSNISSIVIHTGAVAAGGKLRLPPSMPASEAGSQASGGPLTGAAPSGTSRSASAAPIVAARAPVLSHTGIATSLSSISSHDAVFSRARGVRAAFPVVQSREGTSAPQLAMPAVSEASLITPPPSERKSRAVARHTMFAGRVGMQGGSLTTSALTSVMEGSPSVNASTRLLPDAPDSPVDEKGGHISTGGGGAGGGSYGSTSGGALTRSLYIRKPEEVTIPHRRSYDARGDEEADAPAAGAPAAATATTRNDGATLVISLQSFDLGTDEGVSALNTAIRDIMTRNLLTEASRTQLRDALRVFVAIMLSSAALLLARGIVTFAFPGTAVSQWWYQLLVTWLPDVPPCLGYLVLMWPIDDEDDARAHRSELGTLFRALVGTDVTADVDVGGARSAGEASPMRALLDTPIMSAAAARALDTRNELEVALMDDVYVCADDAVALSHEEAASSAPAPSPPRSFAPSQAPSRLSTSLAEASIIATGSPNASGIEMAHPRKSLPSTIIASAAAATPVPTWPHHAAPSRRATPTHLLMSRLPSIRPFALPLAQKANIPDAFSQPTRVTLVSLAVSHVRLPPRHSLVFTHIQRLERALRSVAASLRASKPLSSSRRGLYTPVDASIPSRSHTEPLRTKSFVAAPSTLDAAQDDALDTYTPKMDGSFRGRRRFSGTQLQLGGPSGPAGPSTRTPTSTQAASRSVLTSARAAGAALATAVVPVPPTRRHTRMRVPGEEFVVQSRMLAGAGVAAHARGRALPPLPASARGRGGGGTGSAPASTRGADSDDGVILSVRQLQSDAGAYEGTYDDASPPTGWSGLDAYRSMKYGTHAASRAASSGLASHMLTDIPQPPSAPSQPPPPPPPRDPSSRALTRRTSMWQRHRRSFTRQGMALPTLDASGVPGAPSRSGASTIHASPSTLTSVHAASRRAAQHTSPLLLPVSENTLTLPLLDADAAPLPPHRGRHRSRSDFGVSSPPVTSSALYARGGDSDGDDDTESDDDGAPDAPRTQPATAAHSSQADEEEEDDDADDAVVPVGARASIFGGNTVLRRARSSAPASRGRPSVVSRSGSIIANGGIAMGASAAAARMRRSLQTSARGVKASLSPAATRARARGAAAPVVAPAPTAPTHKGKNKSASAARVARRLIRAAARAAHSSHAWQEMIKWEAYIVVFIGVAAAATPNASAVATNRPSDADALPTADTSAAHADEQRPGGQSPASTATPPPPDALPALNMRSRSFDEAIAAAVAMPDSPRSRQSVNGGDTPLATALRKPAASPRDGGGADSVWGEDGAPTWRYVGHTEPALLEDLLDSGDSHPHDTSAASVLSASDTDMGSVNEGVRTRERARPAAASSSGTGNRTYAYTYSTFGIAIPLPHALLRDVEAACEAVGIDPSRAVLRFQLRWWDNVDEEAVKCVGTRVDTGCIPNMKVPTLASLGLKIDGDGEETPQDDVVIPSSARARVSSVGAPSTRIQATHTPVTSSSLTPSYMRAASTSFAAPDDAAEADAADGTGEGADAADGAGEEEEEDEEITAIRAQCENPDYIVACWDVDARIVARPCGAAPSRVRARACDLVPRDVLAAAAAGAVYDATSTLKAGVSTPASTGEGGSSMSMSSAAMSHALLCEALTLAGAHDTVSTLTSAFTSTPATMNTRSAARRVLEAAMGGIGVVSPVDAAPLLFPADVSTLTVYADRTVDCVPGRAGDLIPASVAVVDLSYVDSSGRPGATVSTATPAAEDELATAAGGSPAPLSPQRIGGSDDESPTRAPQGGHDRGRAVSAAPTALGDGEGDAGDGEEAVLTSSRRPLLMDTQVYGYALGLHITASAVHVAPHAAASGAAGAHRRSTGGQTTPGGPSSPAPNQVAQLDLYGSLSFSVLECTCESAFTALVPQLLIPLIAHRRLRQLAWARQSLEVYLFALNNLQRPERPLRLAGGQSARTGAPTPRAVTAAALAATPKLYPHSAAHAPARPPPPAPPAATASKASQSFINSLYGSLVGHLERQEEIQGGISWLTQRTVRLQAYCEELLDVLSTHAGASVPPALVAMIVAGGDEGEDVDDVTRRRSLLPSRALSRDISLAALARVDAEDAAGGELLGMTTFKTSASKKDKGLRYLPTNLHVQQLALVANVGVDSDVIAVDAGELVSHAHDDMVYVTSEPEEDVMLPPQHHQDPMMHAHSVAGGGGIARQASLPIPLPRLSGTGGLPVRASVSDVMPSARGSPASSAAVTTFTTGTGDEDGPKQLPAAVVSPQHRVLERTHGITTVGAPAAHVLGFKSGGGMGHGLTKLLTSLTSTQLYSARELVANAAMRDLEDARLTMKFRADAVALQAISAICAAFTTSLVAAFDDVASSSTSVALLRAHAAAPQGSATVRVQALLHAIHCEGFRTLRQWACVGYLAGWESLLSCMGKERGMLDDMRFGIAAASLVSFVCVDDDSPMEAPSAGQGDTGVACSHTPAPGEVHPAIHDCNCSSAHSFPRVQSGRMRVMPRNVYTRIVCAALRTTASADRSRGSSVSSIPSAAQVVGAAAPAFNAPRTPSRGAAAAPAAASTPTATTLLDDDDERCGIVFIVPVRGLARAAAAGLIPPEMCGMHSHAHEDAGGVGCAPLPLIRVFPVLLSQGINEMNSVGSMMGTLALQHAINADACKLMLAYAQRAAAHAAAVAMSHEMMCDALTRALSASSSGACRAYAEGVRALSLSLQMRIGGSGRNDTVKLASPARADAAAPYVPPSMSSPSSRAESSPSHTALPSLLSPAAMEAVHSPWSVYSDGLVGKKPARLVDAAAGGAVTKRTRNRSSVDSRASNMSLRDATRSMREEVLRVLDWMTPAAHVSSVTDAVTIPSMERHAPEDVTALLHTMACSQPCDVHGVSALQAELASVLGDASAVAACKRALAVAEAHIHSDSARARLAASLCADLRSTLTGDMSVKQRTDAHVSVAAAVHEAQNNLTHSTNTPTGAAAHASGSRARASRVSLFDTPAGGGRSGGDTGDYYESIPAHLLRVFEDLTRVLRGGRLTSCKSAKDRTGMSVTFEESRLIAEFETAAIALTSACLTTLARPEWTHTQPHVRKRDAAMLTGSSSMVCSDSSRAHGPAHEDALARVTCTPALDASLHTAYTLAFAQLARDMYDSTDTPATVLPFFAQIAAVSSAVSQAFPRTLLSTYDFLYHAALRAAGLRLAHAGGVIVDDDCLLLQCDPTEAQLQAGPAAAAGTDADAAAGVHALAGTHWKVPVTSPFTASLTTADDAACASVLYMSNFMREYGSRLTNAEKNTGVPRFAFNKFQRAFFPMEYQCPVSVIGNKDS